VAALSQTGSKVAFNASPTAFRAGQASTTALTVFSVSTVAITISTGDTFTFLFDSSVGNLTSIVTPPSVSSAGLSAGDFAGTLPGSNQVTITYNGQAKLFSYGDTLSLEVAFNAAAKVGTGKISFSSRFSGSVNGNLPYTTVSIVDFANGGVAAVSHDGTLTGNGTNGSPLGVAVPLNLNASVSDPVISITNTGFGDGLDIKSLGKGIAVTGDTALIAEGTGLFAGALILGGESGSIDASGIGLVAGGGNNFAGGNAGAGIDVSGGSSFTTGGVGISSVGGDAEPFPGQGSGLGGAGVHARGGVATGPAGAGGDGIFAQPGVGANGAKSGLAGNFQGDVQVTGNLSKGGGSFKIDHPLDPANKYLYHSFVESPDMMNIYNGNITTDATGEAVVTLPDWFQALNRDFRYQLTVIGQFAQAIVARKISDNSFTIRTSAPGVEVSWQVTGIRQDAWANAHRIPVDQDKSEPERGYYLHPELFNQPEEKGIEWARHPSMMQRMKEGRAQKRPQERN